MNSNTSQFISAGQILVTDGLGGTVWMNAVSTLSVVGGIGYLPSTISSFSTGIYYINVSMSSFSTDMYTAISTLSTAIATTGGTVSQNQLVSSMAGIGGAGYVSSSTLSASLSSFGSTIVYLTNSTITSSINGLGTSGFVSTASLVSSVVGLGQVGYVSTASLTSSITGLGSARFVSTASLVSTVAGLGAAGYLSSLSLSSTLDGLGSFNYISTASLVSSVAGLYGAIQYAASNPITTSTVAGLGTAGYVSTASLVSTVAGISSIRNGIRFDTTTSVTTVGSQNLFVNVGTLIYISTFLTSSIYYSGNNSSTIVGKIPLGLPHDMSFSTASIDFSPFSSFINSNSRIILDIYPTLAFTKLATGATAPAMLVISSFLQVGSYKNFSTTVNSYMFAGNTRIQLEDGSYCDSSNVYNAPIKMSLPPGTVSSFSTYSLVHYMPSSINNASYQNALHSTLVVPYFASTNSIFVSIQNIQ